MNSPRIAIFASGSGTNAQAIIDYFARRKTAEVALVASNKEDAYVLERARNAAVPAWHFTSQMLKQETPVLDKLRKHRIDFIVLAGFLLKIPDAIIAAYSAKIINIHPALLPLYGGKGMYGMKVHTAVIEAGEKESGITIHYVNQEYDKGDVIYQARCPVHAEDTPESLAQRIHTLEHKYFPRVIEQLIA